MTDIRYRIRIVPKTMGCAWKVVNPEGKTVSVGTSPTDALSRMSREDFNSMAFPKWWVQQELAMQFRKRAGVVCIH